MNKFINYLCYDTTYLYNIDLHWYSVIVLFLHVLLVTDIIQKKLLNFIVRFLITIGRFYSEKVTKCDHHYSSAGNIHKYIELNDTIFYNYMLGLLIKDDGKCQAMLYDEYTYRRMIETNGRFLRALIVFCSFIWYRV